MLFFSYPQSAKNINNEQGFAVLTSAILLSLASIIFTVNMVSSQLIDNKVIANYYRNNEAFANASSGINFVLAQLDDSLIAESILVNLPFHYESAIKHYSVSVKEVAEGKVKITSLGTSMDGTAQRKINLEVEFYLNYPIPAAAVSTNGKLNLDENALINDGCEGLGIDSCLASGNIASKMLVSNPDIETDSSDELCAGGHIGENLIAEGVLKGESEQKIIPTKIDEEGNTNYEWGKVSIAPDSQVGEISSNENMQASSLFEATFGFEMSQTNLDNLWDYAVNIDMTTGGDCSQLLQSVRDQDEIIFIKGDCNINQYDALQSQTSENKTFTIGSVDHPKLVFIEGGTFITEPDIVAAVVGILYFLPGTHDSIDEDSLAIQIEDSSVDMGGVNVNGALLSEYKCSYNGDAQTDNNQNKQHFSARFDKHVLDTLYSTMGMGSTGSNYRLSAGTWKDF